MVIVLISNSYTSTQRNRWQKSAQQNSEALLTYMKFLAAKVQEYKNKMVTQLLWLNKLKFPGVIHASTVGRRWAQTHQY